jgi:DMSO reductase anchor subunit
MKERSLIAFTLLSQMAVGLFCCNLVCFCWLLPGATVEQASLWSMPGFLLSAGVMVAAMFASFLHLGNPLNAWRAASGYRSSWLSREIILVLVFAVATVLFARMVMIEMPPTWLRQLLGIICALVGICLVYTMSRVYLQRTVPAWNSWLTVAHFLLATLSIGAVVTSLVWVMNAKVPWCISLDVGKIWNGLLVIILLLKLVAFHLWLHPVEKTGAYKESLAVLSRSHGRALAWHLILQCLALFTAIVFLVIPCENLWTLQKVILWVTALLVFIAEILGRRLFYIAWVRTGV